MAARAIRGSLALLVASVALVACGTPDPVPGASGTPTTPPATVTATATSSPTVAAASLRASADAVLIALRDEDYAALSELADPAGIRFSPYAYVDLEGNVVIPADELASLGSDTTERTWGSYDGSGEPITGTFADYREEFLWDQDYLSADEVAENTVLGSGNSMNNLAEAYPDAEFVEYHFDGFDPEFEGLDWKSLRVVLTPTAEGGWTVVGIVHDQWTI